MHDASVATTAGAPGSSSELLLSSRQQCRRRRAAAAAAVAAPRCGAAEAAGSPRALGNATRGAGALARQPPWGALPSTEAPWAGQACLCAFLSPQYMGTATSDSSLGRRAHLSPALSLCVACFGSDLLGRGRAPCVWVRRLGRQGCASRLSSPPSGEHHPQLVSGGGRTMRQQTSHLGRQGGAASGPRRSPPPALGHAQGANPVALCGGGAGARSGTWRFGAFCHHGGGNAKGHSVSGEWAGGGGAAGPLPESLCCPRPCPPVHHPKGLTARPCPCRRQR